MGIGTGGCLWGAVPYGEVRWHLPVPKLHMARSGTALNEPPASLLREGGVLGVSGLRKEGALWVSFTLLTAFPSLP